MNAMNATNVRTGSSSQ